MIRYWMNKVAPLQIVEQQRLNTSISLGSNSQSLFKLFLAMASDDMTQQLRVESPESNISSTNESSLQHHYRHASFTFDKQDYLNQANYRACLTENKLDSLRLLACMHPQGLSAHNDAMRIDVLVRENSAFHSQEALNNHQQLLAEQSSEFDSAKSSDNNTIYEQPTMLFDLLEEMS